MARLHQRQGKAELAVRGAKVPHGGVARTPQEAERIASDLGGPVILKRQAWSMLRR